MIEKQMQPEVQVKDIMLIEGLKQLENKFKSEINAITVGECRDQERELSKLFGLLRKTEQKVWSLQVEVTFND